MKTKQGYTRDHTQELLEKFQYNEMVILQRLLFRQKNSLQMAKVYCVVSIILATVILMWFAEHINWYILVFVFSIATVIPMLRYTVVARKISETSERLLSLRLRSEIYSRDRNT